jgi:hypothetical protein
VKKCIGAAHQAPRLSRRLIHFADFSARVPEFKKSTARLRFGSRGDSANKNLVDSVTKTPQ